MKTSCLLKVGTTIGLLAAGLLSSTVVRAQAPTWHEAEAVGNSSLVTATATDERGSVLVAGTFTGSLTLGSTTLNSNGDADIFVAKRNSISGAYLWARRAGGPGPDYVSSLVTTNGRVYIAGAFGSATADFGPVVLSRPGGSAFAQEAFVAKLNDLGSSNTGFVWAVAGSGPTSGERQVNGLALADSTTLYAVGSFRGASLTLGTTTLANAGASGRDAFISKLTDAGATGSFTWALPAGGDDNDEATAVTANAAGVYVVGDFASAVASFGTEQLFNSDPAQIFTDAFVVRVNDAGPTGAFAWATGSSGAGYEVPSSVTALGSTVYVAGSYATATTATSFGSTTLPLNASEDIFVARLNDFGTSGAFAWATWAGGSSGDAASAIALGTRGLYLAGNFNSPSATFGTTTLSQSNTNGDAFVARLTDNTTSGTFDWATAGGGTGLDGARSLALAGGHVWLGGYVGASAATFGTHPVPAANAGGSTGLLAHLIDGHPRLDVRAAGVSYPSGTGVYDFGSVAVGSSTGIRSFYLVNQGPAAPGNTGVLTLLDFSFGGFGGSSGYPTPPYNVGPGDSTYFTLSLRPTTPGVQTGSVTIYSDDPTQPSYVFNYRINGTAVVPAAVAWTGAVSTDWNTPGNWNPAAVPGAITAVSIPVTPNQPLLTTTASCSTLRSVNGTTLSIAAPAYLTIADDLQANGRVVMTGGTLEARGFAVYFNGGLAATGGTVLLSGNSTQEVGRNGGGATFWNLTVGPRATNAVRPYGGTISVQRVLTLYADIDVNGGLVNLLSDATGTAMVVNKGGLVAGFATMQRYTAGPNAGQGYRHYSFPTSYRTPGNFYGLGFTAVLNAAYNTTGNTVTPFPTFFGFEEARLGAAGVPGPAGFDQGWYSPTTLTDQLGAARGYTINVAGTTRLISSGGLTTGDVPVGTLSHSGSGAFAGYHLLGNPYPAPIDWDSVARPAGLDNAVYVFRSTGQYTGFYDAYVNGLGTLPNGEIAAMQGFFVHVSQAVPSFTFTNAARKTVYANPTFQRGTTGTSGTRPTLALALRPATGGEADQTFIYFENGATAARDAAYDAGKLPNTSGLNLASQLGADSYAINGLPLLGTQPLVLPLTVGVPATGRYELAVDQLTSFAPGTTLYLRDALLNTLTPLTASTRYAFSLSGYTAPGRFALEFRPAGALATTAQVLEAQVQLFPNPAKAAAGVTVATPAGARVTVLNALGQIVLPACIVGASAMLPLPTAGLAAGLYVVRISTAAGEVSRRLVVE
jgi:hypothetical protein